MEMWSSGLKISEFTSFTFTLESKICQGPGVDITDINESVFINMNVSGWIL